jgi:hypothetical protein
MRISHFSLPELRRLVVAPAIALAVAGAPPIIAFQH